MYSISYSNRAKKDSILIKQAGLGSKIYELLNIIINNPYQNPPQYKKLSGYSNRFSRRINIQHRLVYAVLDDEIIILQMWTHYE